MAAVSVQVTKAPVGAGLPQHKIRKILILEDSKGVRHDFRTILHHDHTVHVVSSIEQAVATFSHFQPDMVLSDVVVPCAVIHSGIEITSGMEFLEWVKKQSPTTKTIIMSSGAATILHPSDLPQADASLSKNGHAHHELLELIKTLSEEFHGHEPQLEQIQKT
jgi:DNA-binding NtrC family response regulator